MSAAETFQPADYELIDFGGGRRLERFAGVMVDRPCPTAEGVVPNSPARWREATARFDRSPSEQQGRWTLVAPLPEPWTIDVGPLRLALRCTPFGQVGLFPEHAHWWRRLPQWLGARCRSAGTEANSLPARLRALHLFAYTGAGTLAAACCGAEVVHVDAAANMLAHARANAELSGLTSAPIRWIAEDALKFVKRELRRGAQYDAVILDPPSDGHGPRGEVWRLSRHLPRLLELCAQLTVENRRLIVLTCHTPGYGTDRLAEMLSAAMVEGPAGEVESESLSLVTADGRSLPCGAMAVWRTSDPPYALGLRAVGSSEDPLPLVAGKLAGRTCNSGSVVQELSQCR